MQIAVALTSSPSAQTDSSKTLDIYAIDVEGGNATLFVVGPGNRAVQRTVQADRALGTNWVVTGGLAPGEKIIVQGTANLKDGAPVKPVPASTPQRLRTGPPGASRYD